MQKRFIYSTRAILWTSLSILSLAASAQEGGPPGAKPQDGPKKYDSIITKDAVTQEGVFKVHQIKNKIYFEIPKSQLGRDMLVTSELAEVPFGLSTGQLGNAFPGTAVGEDLIRWTRREDKIFIRRVDYSLRTDDRGGFGLGVQANTVLPILMAFNIETEGPDESAVIDVTRLFLSDPSEFSVKGAAGGGSVDGSRSYLDSIHAFPTNIETRSMLTFSGQKTATVLVHYSMVMLPEKPMKARISDPRVGYFTQSFLTIGTPKRRVEPIEYIDRFRLEKKDPSQAVSEPVKPIVFYLAPEVPEKWRKCLKAGIEMWQPAFERAGFKNAILAKDAPTKAEDPSWHPEDARYSVIRWAPSNVQNAMGPSIQDPRSGETISAHVIMWNDIVRLAEAWYFIQASPSDSRAQKLPLPDDIVEDLVKYVVAHEVGHTLGLRHNFLASAAYTPAQLRDPVFTAKYGTAASIMDYARFNYVAQPEDKAELLTVLGPYDYFAIEYGYKPIDAISSAGEKPELDRMLRRQLDDPMLRYHEDYQGGAGPHVRMEDFTNDPIEATRLGLLNLKRVMGYLVSATTESGRDYKLLDEMFGGVLGQRKMEMDHVVALLGGLNHHLYAYGNSGAFFEPVPAAQQRKAVAFLIENGLTTPTWLMPKDVVSRVGGPRVMSALLNDSVGLMNAMTSEGLVDRLLVQQVTFPGEIYAPRELLSDVQMGVWKEVYTPSPKADFYRRSLQRAYLDMLQTRLLGPNPSKREVRALSYESILDLQSALKRSLKKTTDPETLRHFNDSLRHIDAILNPKPMPAAPAAGAPDGGRTVRFGGAASTESIATQSGDAWPRKKEPVVCPWHQHAH